MSPDPVIAVPVGLFNEYRLTTHKADARGNPIPGTAVDRTGWFHNLITDYGMNQLGVQRDNPSRWGYGCRVGAGNAAPTPSDTNLQSPIATTTSYSRVSLTRQLQSPPYYIELTMRYRFGLGAAAGNVSEVGLVSASNAGDAANPATQVVTRALVVDGSGNPMVVTVLADEILDVTVRQRLYIPGDVTGTIVPAGGVSGPIDYVIRPCDVDQDPDTNVGGWGGYSSNTGWGFGIKPGEGFVFLGANSGIQSITEAPSGTKVNGGSGAYTSPAYIPDSYYTDAKLSLGLDVGNNANGIGAAMLPFGSCSFQIGFTPRIMKTADHLFDVTLRLTWSRFTP